MHAETIDLHQVMVFLFAAGIVVPLASRLKISPVLGFLIVGLFIGPFGMARFAEAAPWLEWFLITDLEGVRLLAELGIVFLLFMIGLELSIERLWAMRRLVFGLGGAQVMTCGIVIALIASLFNNTLTAAVILGASFALSSTAVVMQLLSEKRRLGTTTGQTSFAILLFQDLAVLPILFLVAAFAAQSGASIGASFALAIGEAALAIGLILFIGRLVIRPVFRFVGSTASREMFLALVLLVIIGTALATQLAGLSMALGAFMAGLLFSETEYRHEIEVDIEPFKGLFLGLFFVSVGMSIDLTKVLANPFWLPASVVGLYLVKSPIIYGLARLFRVPHAPSLESSLLLGQGGEFALLTVGLAYQLGLIPSDTSQFMLIVTGLTMFATPTVAHFARRLAQRVEAREAQQGQKDSDLPEGLAAHVIVVGYGRVGQMLGTVLEGQEIPHVGLDIDPHMVAAFRSVGSCIYYGDARQPEILKKFNIDEATALVVTMDDANASEQVVTAVRRHWPSLIIYARARDRAHAARLIKAGATHAIPETVEASLQMGEMILAGVGVPEEAARRVIEARRQAEQAGIDEAEPA